MSKRKQAKERERKAREAAARAARKRREEDRRPLWLSSSEASLLAGLLKVYDEKHHLLDQIAEVKRLLEDNASRLREITARANATGFWEELKTGNEALLWAYQGRAKGGKHKAADNVVACLSPEEMLELLEEERGKQ